MTLFDMMPDGVKLKLSRKKFQPYETILFAEYQNNYIYFLLDGKAEAYVPNSQGIFANIYIYEPGSFFGELEQFYEGRKPVEISAMTPCVVAMLHKNELFDWLKKDFEATKYLIKEMAYKLIVNSDYIEEVTLLTVRERLLRCIAIHYRQGNIASLTKEQLAKETKAPVRSVNRAIAECAKQGILFYRNKQIIILNEKKIQSHLR